MDKLKVTYEQSMAKNGNDHNCHTMCVIDQMISSGALDGKCRSCQNDDCQVLGILQDEARDQPAEHPLIIFVKDCPQDRKYGWFHPRPDLTIEEINKQAKELLEKQKAKALKAASGGTQ